MDPAGVPIVIHDIGRTDFVSVFLTPADTQIKRDFHCVQCGRIVFNYYGNVKLIYMGETSIQEYDPDGSQPYDIMCSRCKKMYRAN